MNQTVYRETVLDAPVDTVWRLVKTSALLETVCRPLVTFRGVDPPELPTEWPPGETVTLKSYLFGVLPLGTRTLRFVAIDESSHVIQTEERDPMIHRWDHRIHVATVSESRSLYSDEIVIDAGLLTPFVVLFAKFFYRHRQRRWERIVLRDK